MNKLTLIFCMFLFLQNSNAQRENENETSSQNDYATIYIYRPANSTGGVLYYIYFNNQKICNLKAAGYLMYKIYTTNRLKISVNTSLLGIYGDFSEINLNIEKGKNYYFKTYHKAFSQLLSIEQLYNPISEKKFKQKKYISLNDIGVSNQNTENESEKGDTDWTNEKLIEHWTKNGISDFEGIYERVSEHLEYKLAILKENNDYKVIYLSGASGSGWHEGDIKAILRKTAQIGIYKSNWKLINKSSDVNAIISFESGNMKVLLENNEKNQDSYLKMYPTYDDISTSIPVLAKNNLHPTTTITPVSLSSDVDKNIPQNPTKNHNKYALIIGNEDYSSRQTNLHKENNVPFAINDAKTFKDYCVQSLGIDESNVFLLFNATAGEMSNKIQVLTEILKRLGNKAELIVYYAGHGFPDEKTKAAYLIPVDVSPNNLNSAIKLQDLYNKLSATKAAKINFFIDACFTGGGREESLVSGARGIKIVPNEDALTGNVVVFSATTNDQTALPFKDKQHGMFTYYILKALQNAKGKIKFADLERYVKENVAIQSLKINAKEQDPTIKVSPAVKNTYLNWEF